MYSIAVSIYGPLAVRDKLVAGMLDATIAYDTIEFLNDPSIPGVLEAYRAGALVYRTTGCDEDSCTDVPWEDPKTILARGWTDCKNIVKWRIVELRLRHGLSVTYALHRVTTPAGDVIYHPTVVGYFQGQRVVEDTSSRLGMGQEGSILP